MATNYKRHSQGGRFKRTDAGDLGIRAYKDQQNRIINALKLQNKQDQERRREFARDIEGNAVQELQHNRELKSLKDDVFKVAMDNTKIRADREVESLETQAKEAGKKADFWKDFSTTYSKQYAQAAGTLHKMHRDKVGEQQAEAVFQSEDWDTVANQTDALQKIFSVEQLNEALKVHQNKNLSDVERSKYTSHISDQNFRIDNAGQQIVVAKILKEWEAYDTQLEKEVIERGLPWNEVTIGKFYYLKKHELLTKLGISPTSPAGRKLSKGIDEELGERIPKLTNISIAKDDADKAKQYNETSQAMVGSVKDESTYAHYHINKNLEILHSANSYKIDKNSNVIIPTTADRNLVDHFKIVIEKNIKSNDFVSLDQAKAHSIHLPIPGHKNFSFDKDGKIVFKQTWGGKHPTLEKWVEEIWTENTLETKKGNDDNLKSRGINALDLFEQRVQNGEIKITDNEALEKFKLGNSDLTHKDAHVPNTISLYQVFNQTDKNNNIVNMNLFDLYEDYDIKGLTEYMTFLDPATKENWLDRKEQVTELDSNGYGKQDITAKAQDILYDVLDYDGTQGTLKGYSDMIDLIKQDILFEYAAVSKLKDADKMNVTQKLDLMNDRIQKKIKEKQGIYRRTGTGLKTEFAVVTGEKGKTDAGVGVAELDKAIEKHGLDTIFQSMDLKNDTLTGGQFYLEDGTTAVNLISTDDADSAIKSLKKGQTIGYNAAVSRIVEAQGVDKTFTERDVWNLYFKSKGLDYFVPPGAMDLSTYKLEKSKTDIPQKNRSPENELTLSIWAEGNDLGILPTYNPKTLENFTFNNQFRTDISASLYFDVDGSKPWVSDKHWKLLIGEKSYNRYFKKK